MKKGLQRLVIWLLAIGALPAACANDDTRANGQVVFVPARCLIS